MKERMFLLYNLVDEDDYNSRIQKIKKEIGTDYIINIDPYNPETTFWAPIVIIMANKKQWKRIKSLLSLEKIYY